MFIIPMYKFVSYISYNIFGAQLDSLGWIKHKIGQLIDLRVKKKLERKDFMQLLLNVMTDEVSTIHDHKQIDEVYNINMPKQLARQEAEANIIIFMLAGYETSSTTLSFASHALALNQDVQRKLYEEIDQAFGQDSEKIPDTDNVKELVYLDYFLKETMRFYPILFL